MVGTVRSALLGGAPSHGPEYRASARVAAAGQTSDADAAAEETPGQDFLDGLFGGTSAEFDEHMAPNGPILPGGGYNTAETARNISLTRSAMQMNSNLSRTVGTDLPRIGVELSKVARPSVSGDMWFMQPEGYSWAADHGGTFVNPTEE